MHMRGVTQEQLHPALPLNPGPDSVQSLPLCNTTGQLLASCGANEAEPACLLLFKHNRMDARPADHALMCEQEIKLSSVIYAPLIQWL